jgi:predicted nuclease with TOPRIM domain
MEFLLWFVKNPIATLAIVGLIGMSVLAGKSHWDNATLATDKATLETTVAHQKTENDRLTLEKTTLEDSLKNLKLEVDLTKKAQSQLEETIAHLSDLHQADAQALEEIKNAPASDDGPVAPVLRRTLERMRPGN